MSNKSSLLQKFHCPIEDVPNSLQTKGPGTSFQATDFADFFDEIFSLVI